MGEAIISRRGGSDSGGVGKTIVISRSHEGEAAPLTSPLQIGYYQELAKGTGFNNISLKEDGKPVAVTRSIVDRDKVQLDDFYLAADTQYDVDIPAMALKDRLGNVLKGVYRYSFTTESFQAIFIVTPEATKPAFDAVIAKINRDGGTIYFTEGEFRGLFPITITHSDVTLKGEGANTKIICDTPKNSGTGGVISVTGTAAVPLSNVTIECMTIDGDYSSDNANRNYFGLSLSYVSNSVVRECVIQNSGHNGIMLPNSSNNRITRNISQNNKGDGIHLVYSSANNTVTGNISQNNDGVGINLASSITSNIVTRNTIQNNGNNGINLASSNNTIIGNTFQNNGGGIYSYGSTNSDNTITGNIFQNNQGNGIGEDSSAANTSISANVCQNNGANEIYVNTRTSNTIILANIASSITNEGTNTILSQNITA